MDITAVWLVLADGEPMSWQEGDEYDRVQRGHGEQSGNYRVPSMYLTLAEAGEAWTEYELARRAAGMNADDRVIIAVRYARDKRTSSALSIKCVALNVAGVC